MGTITEESLALHLACTMHLDSQYGDGPYALHPIRVAHMVKRGGGTRVAVLAGYLHDTVEDSSYTLGQMADTFGAEVATAVELLTRQEGETYDQYLDRLTSSRNMDAMLVKLCDLTDNLNQRPGASLTKRYQLAKTRIGLEMAK